MMHRGDGCAVTARVRPRQAGGRRRPVLLTTTALAGSILAAATAGPQRAWAFCTTTGVDPVTVTCDAPGATIAFGAGQFNADVIGIVTANTTVSDGFGLFTTKASGAVTLTDAGNISSASGNAIAVGGINGLSAVTVTGGTIAAGNDGIFFGTSGNGGFTVNMTGGQIGTSATPVGEDGINALIFTPGYSGNITITSTTVFATNVGINADIFDRAAAGAVSVTANGSISATGADSFGVVAGTRGAGAVQVATSANVTAVTAGIVAFATTSAVKVTAGANVTGGAVGISAGATTGAISVTTAGTVTGGSGTANTFGIGAAVELVGGSNNTLVNSGSIVNSNGLAGIAILGIPAFSGQIGNNTVNNSGTVAGIVDLGGGANAFNNLAGGAFLAGPTVRLGTGNTLANAGTFSPGGPSVMTTALTGNYTQSASGTYAVAVSPAAASRTNISGTASISGAAQALALPGTYTGQAYTILTASGGVSGTFGALSVSGSFGPAVRPMLSYDANDVFLLLFPQAGLASLVPGASGNQRSVGSAVDAGVLAGNSLPAFLPLFNLTPGGLGTALSQLSGEAATGAPTATFQAGAQFLALMVDPLVDAWSAAGAVNRPLGFAPAAEALPSAASAIARAVKAPLLTKAPPRAPAIAQGFTAWAAGYGGQGTLDGDAAAGSHDLTARSAGFAAGLDYRLAPNAVVGLAAAGGSLSFGLADGLGSGRGDGAQAGLYGKARFGDAYVAAAAALASHDLSTDRIVTGVPGTFEHLTADFTATSYGGRIETGRRFAMMPQLGVTPYAAWQGQSVTTPDYMERDAAGLAGAAFALSFHKQTTTDERTELGAWLDSGWRVSEGATLTLRDRAAWVHDFTSDRSITALFQTLPTQAFTVLGAAPAPDAALLSGRADLAFRNNVSLFARFDGEFAQRAQTYSGSGGVKVTW